MIQPVHRSTERLPDHVESTVEEIARVHTQHFENAAPLQRVANALTQWLGRPGVLAGLTVFIVLWIGVNVAAPRWGHAAWDPAPFLGLQGVACICGLYVSILILSSSRHADELATHREQLTLELSILAERKTAKIIALMEEMRRDSPALPDRKDADAASLAQPADPRHVLDAIRDAQGGRA